MDQITHDVRRTQWLDIITACQARPEGITVKQWLIDNGIANKAYYYWLRKFRREAYDQMKSNASTNLPEQQSSAVFAEIPLPRMSHETTLPFAFSPDAVIRSGDCIVAVSNSISDSLLRAIMEGMKYAR